MYGALLEECKSYSVRLLGFALNKHIIQYAEEKLRDCGRRFVAERASWAAATVAPHVVVASDCSTVS